MIPINSHKIIGAAVYDTMLDLSKDDKYIDSLLAYEYELGLHSFETQVDETDKVLLAIEENPNLALFFYCGDTFELAGLYNTSLNGDGKASYQNRYIGIWNIVPKPIKRKNGFVSFDFDIAFIAPINPDWSSEARENLLFLPIFDKIRDTFLKNLERYPYIKNKAPYGIDYEEDRNYNFDSSGQDLIGDYISYMRLTFTLDVSINECEREFKTLEDKYLILKKINSYE